MNSAMQMLPLLYSCASGCRSRAFSKHSEVGFGSRDVDSSACRLRHPGQAWEGDSPGRPTADRSQRSHCSSTSTASISFPHTPHPTWMSSMQMSKEDFPVHTTRPSICRPRPSQNNTCTCVSLLYQLQVRVSPGRCMRTVLWFWVTALPITHQL